MAEITIVKDKLTDGSVIFDILIQNNGEKITLELPSADGDEGRVNSKVNEFHKSLERLLGETVSWHDTLDRKAGW